MELIVDILTLLLLASIVVMHFKHLPSGETLRMHPRASEQRLDRCSTTL